MRLYYDYLVEEGLRLTNPVGRGYYVRGRSGIWAGQRGLVARLHQLPWIPSEEQWRGAGGGPTGALAQSPHARASLRCGLAQGGIVFPTHRRHRPRRQAARVRAQTSKSRRDRVVPFSAPTAILFAAYLQDRRRLGRQRGPLFLSQSKRNLAQPISVWTWSKVVAAIARRAGVGIISPPHPAPPVPDRPGTRRLGPA